ncbi:hypothetical protein OOK60_18040 [Trichothermofontia sichuanensis B231]|uniref:hypothetical protein n=1 Tax=Trichothermofontia sichuanensis TaxID=3045816 RepID=UPI002245EBF1|nr:hypothetical protein [Trichothermofontia sichuanensis]UZQ54352.1 hypothetical protein OOK60_18040 [Trichothermofontia sichuanensis B231]
MAIHPNSGRAVSQKSKFDIQAGEWGDRSHRRLATGGPHPLAPAPKLGKRQRAYQFLSQAGRET